jgi:hypothetical protein
VDARQAFVIETFAHLDRRSVVKGTAGKSDGFGDHVIRRDQDLGEPLRVELLEDLADPLVIGVFLRCEGKEKARVDEDHFL